MKHEDEFTHRPELIRQRERDEFIKRLLLGVLVFYCVLNLTFQTYGFFVSNQQRDAIVSCTSPHGTCYEHSQEATNKAIAALVNNGEDRSRLTRRIVVIAVACGQDPNIGSDPAAVTQCVQDELDKEGKPK